MLKEFKNFCGGVITSV